jgi:hypothetical protein
MKTTEELLRRELKRRYATDNGARLAVALWLGLVLATFAGCANLAGIWH